MLYTLLFFLLFLLPFVVFPFGATPFETPKIIAAELSILAMLGVTLFSTGGISGIFNKRMIPLGILFILTLAQLFFQKSDILFFGNTFRMQGIFLLWMLLAISIISSSIRLRYPSLLLVSILLLLHLAAEFFIIGGTDERAIGTIGEPNAFAAVLLFLWPFLYILNKPSPKEVILQQIGLVIAGFVILMTGSRSGMIAFSLQIVFLLMQHYLHIPLKKTAVIVLLLFFTSLSLPFFDTDTMYERRDEIWKAALIAGYEHPYTGWGFGNTEMALEKYNDKLYNSAHGYYVDSSHNIFLDWWVQGGIVGLSVLVLLLYYVFRRFIREKNAVYLIILFGLIGAMSFNPVSVVTLIPLWFLLGHQLQE